MGLRQRLDATIAFTEDLQRVSVSRGRLPSAEQTEALHTFLAKTLHLRSLLREGHMHLSAPETLLYGEGIRCAVDFALHLRQMKNHGDYAECFGSLLSHLRDHRIIFPAYVPIPDAPQDVHVHYMSRRMIGDVVEMSRNQHRDFWLTSEDINAYHSNRGAVGVVALQNNMVVGSCLRERLYDGDRKLDVLSIHHLSATPGECQQAVHALLLEVCMTKFLPPADFHTITAQGPMDDGDRRWWDVYRSSGFRGALMRSGTNCECLCMTMNSPFVDVRHLKNSLEENP